MDVETLVVMCTGQLSAAPIRFQPQGVKVPNPKTVLIVDDESGMRKLIARVLKNHNFHLLQAENGPKALEILDGWKKIDLLLLDVMMPDMNGYEVLNKMAEKGIDKDIFVIMLSGLKARQDIVKGYNVGAHYYITKPFKEETLLNIVEYLIGDLPPEERRRRESLF
jgi:DNA-binding response OmpR family regulator